MQSPLWYPKKPVIFQRLKMENYVAKYLKKLYVIIYVTIYQSISSPLKSYRMRERGEKRMDKWFKSKWFVRIISLAFSIMLFTFVSIEEAELSKNENSIFFPSSSEEMKTIDEVPVQIHINNEKYVVSGVPEHVSVSLEGKTSILTQLVRQQNFDVFVDLEGLGEGEHTVEIQYDNIPHDIAVYIEPKTIDVTIEEKATKEVSVVVDLINQDDVPDGFELGTPVVKPETVTLTSSKSVIDQVAIVKVYVDVAGLTEPIDNREVPVNVYDGQGNELRAKIEPEVVEVSIPVDNPSKTIPIDISTTGSLPDDYSLNSIEAAVDEVEVFAASNLLDEINEIKTKDIDLSDIKESGTVEAELDLPDGVVAPGNNTVDVNIEIEQLKETAKVEETKAEEDEEDEEESQDSTKTVKDIPINVLNNDEDLTVNFIKPKNQSISLTASGDKKDIKNLKPEDIQVSIDVADLDKGKHTLPLNIESPADVKIDSKISEVTVEL